MNFRVVTYLTFTGMIKVIDLSDMIYGGWIIYENKLPKYYVNILEENSTSDLKIRYLIETKKETINSVVDKINTNNSLDLLLSVKPFFSLRTNSKIENLELIPLPDDWVKNI